MNTSSEYAILSKHVQELLIQQNNVRWIKQQLLKGSDQSNSGNEVEGIKFISGEYRVPTGTRALTLLVVGQ